ncbi:hypothetical protein ENBRE01_0961 [Enteropsectra breve]|nr:hypothetical protein ENBRE01_0961 [Enteropsectra breve]
MKAIVFMVAMLSSVFLTACSSCSKCQIVKCNREVFDNSCLVEKNDNSEHQRKTYTQVVTKSKEIDVSSHLQRIEACIRSVFCALRKTAKCDFNALTTDFSKLFKDHNKKLQGQIICEFERADKHTERTVSQSKSRLTQGLESILASNTEADKFSVATAVKIAQVQIIAQLNAIIALPDAEIVAWVKDLANGAIPFMTRETNNITIGASSAINDNSKDTRDAANKFITEESNNMLELLISTLKAAQKRSKKLFVESEAELVGCVSSLYNVQWEKLSLGIENLFNNECYIICFKFMKIIEEVTGTKQRSSIIMPMLRIDRNRKGAFEGF